jgi:hypothetical protein
MIRPVKSETFGPIIRISITSHKPTSGPWKGLHSGEDAFLKWLTSESPVIQKEPIWGATSGRVLLHGP